MGFFEILLIAVVALLVVGPERMPEAVRTLALTIGRIKRQFDNAKTEIEKQVGADEIRRQLHNESILENINKIKSELSAADKLIDSDEQAMPWTEDEYERLQQQQSSHQDDSLDDKKGLSKKHEGSAQEDSASSTTPDIPSNSKQP